MPFHPSYDPLEPDIFPFLSCPPTNEYFNFTNATDSEILSYTLSFEPVTFNLTAYSSESELTDFIKNSENTDQIFMGIVFNETTWNGDSVPDTFDYKIRPLAVPRSETSSKGFESALGWLTNLLYPLFKQRPGPRSAYDKTGGSPYYAAEGFLYFQYLINNAFSMEKNSESSIGPIEMKRFPYPEYTVDNLMLGLKNDLAFTVLITTLYLSSGTAKTLVIEKETRLKEYMLMMGLNRNTLWLATWLFAFMKFIVTALFYTIALFYPFVANGAVFLTSNWVCFFLFLLSYGIALISIGFFMGAIFSTSTSASVATGGLTFLMYIPSDFLKLNGSSTTYGAKLLCSLLPPVSLSLGLETIASWEIAGEGLQFSNFFTPVTTTNPTNVGTQMIMLLVDSLLYYLLGLYIDTISPGQWGIPRPWNFFCMPSYWSPPKKSQVDVSKEIVTENLLQQKIKSGVRKESGFRLRNLIKEFEDNGKLVSNGNPG